MTIGKKLYLGFGAILTILILLFVVNLTAVLGERSARAQAATALESTRTIEAVRFQIMLNRMALQNYLLTGDTRDEEKAVKGAADLDVLLKRGQAWRNSDL